MTVAYSYRGIAVTLNAGVTTLNAGVTTLRAGVTTLNVVGVALRAVVTTHYVGVLKNTS